MSRVSGSRTRGGLRDHRVLSGNWLAQAARDEGRRPGSTTTELAELREAKKRIRLLEQENEVLRRAAAYLSQANLSGK